MLHNFNLVYIYFIKTLNALLTYIKQSSSEHINRSMYNLLKHNCITEHNWRSVFRFVFRAADLRIGEYIHISYEYNSSLGS